MTRVEKPMRAVRRLAGAALGAAALCLSALPATAAGPGGEVVDHDWSFEGPFGTYDREQLQRGWQVFMTACRSCHGLELVRFRNLMEPGGPEFPKEQVDAFAAEWEIALPNGDFREAEITDGIPSPYIDEAEAADANNGAVPPDLSVITKARIGYHGTFKQIFSGMGGPEYLYSLLIGYPDEGAPEGVDEGDGYFNYYYAKGGNIIAMPPPLVEGIVEYTRANGETYEPTVDEMAQDVTAFLTWAAEPHMNARKEAGMRNIAFLTIFAVLLWFSNRKLWKPIKEGRE